MMLADYGGAAGVRAERLLASALARPQQVFAHGDSTMVVLVVAYTAGIVRKHPFLETTNALEAAAGE
jgi:death on curing protein